MPFTLIEAIIIANTIAIFAIGWLAFRHHWQTRQQKRQDQKALDQTHKRSQTPPKPNQARSILFFTLTSLAITAWLISDFLVDKSTTIPSALFWSKITFITSALILNLFFYFVLIFPSALKSRYHKYLLLIYALPTFLFAISPSDLLIKNVYFINEQTAASWHIGFTPGVLYSLFAFHQIAFLAGTLALIIAKYLQSPNTQRRQIKYLALGFAATTTASIIFSVILPTFFHSPAWAKLAPASVIFTVAAAAIALTKHYLLNIKIIAAEILAFFISLTLLVNILLATNREELILRSLSFLIAVSISLWLVRSVWQEVKRRQQIEKLAGQLEKANKRLATLSERKSTFVSMASHELRTPLTSMQGYLTLLRSKKYGGVTSQQEPLFQKCERNLRELEKFVDDLLNLTRIEAGQLDCTKELFNLGKLVEEVVVEMEISARAKKLQVKFSPRTNPLRVKADKKQIEHVLTNLIDNAIKYTDKGKIIVSVSQKGNQATVEVKDTGIGLKPSERKTIFSKFTRADGSWNMNQQGAGLGLYIAKAFITAHGGRIWVKSAGKEQGSTFGFGLPID